MPLHTPAYTQFPNEILEAIPTLSESELKVVSVLVRNTLGFHRHSTKLTMEDLKRQTGLSINSVRAGVAGCIQRLWIRQSPQKPYTYSIWMDYGSKSDPSNFDGSKSDPSMDQNLIHDGSNFDPSMDQNLILSSNKGFKENSKEIAPLFSKESSGESGREEDATQAQPKSLPPPVQLQSVVAANTSGGLSPATFAPAVAHDPFARRGMPQVVSIQAQFQGPWGVGYTDDLKRFEEWLRSHKAKDKHDPSAWIAVVVTGIAKGGSRSLWDEFKRFESTPTSRTHPTPDRLAEVALRVQAELDEVAS